MTNSTVEIFRNQEELICGIADRLVRVIADAIRNRGKCNVSLAGGETPRQLFALLAEEPYKSKIEWSSIHLFWGDERMVPPDHHESNFGMTHRELLSKISIPAENVHRIRGELSPSEAAREYDALLQGDDKRSMTRFDIALLGIGEDAHTASLFPGTTGLDAEGVSTAAVFVPKLNTWRVTLTLNILNESREVIFLVSGEKKAPVVRRIFLANGPSKDMPATLVQPRDGSVTWMLDAAAASLIRTERGNPTETIHFIERKSK